MTEHIKNKKLLYYSNLYLLGTAYLYIRLPRNEFHKEVKFVYRWILL